MAEDRRNDRHVDAFLQERGLWPASEMSLDRFDRWLDLLPDGIVVGAPNRGAIGGREQSSSRWRSAATSSAEKSCAASGSSSTPSRPRASHGGRSKRGFRQRIWVVDGGVHEPLVIITGTPVDNPGFQPTADILLATLLIGEPLPHPIDKD